VVDALHGDGDSSRYCQAMLRENRLVMVGSYVFRMQSS